MHALHLTTWHPCIDGGSGIFVIEQCESLAAAGLEIGLIYSRIQGLRTLTLRNAKKGLPSFSDQKIPFPAFGFSSWNVPFMNRFIPTINRSMLRYLFDLYRDNNGNPDILHAHVALESGVAAREIAERTGTEYIVTEHSSEILNIEIDTKRKEIAKDIYSNAKCVVSVSSFLADRIQNICPNANIKVIGNVVRNHVFKSRRINDRGDKIVIVSIGTLISSKRVHNTIAALSYLPTDLKRKIEFHIVGDGPDRQMLEQMSDIGGVRVTFHGQLEHQDAIRVLARSDFLVHASAYETFGIVIAEATALGLPVIATRCGGPNDIVTSDNGILVPVDDVRSLAKAIQSVSENIAEWRNLSRDIAAVAFAKYHEKHFAKKIMEIYS